MNHYPHYFRWLGIAALVDWLITRTLTRAAIFMPKSGSVITVYQGVSQIGQIAATVASLLVLVALGWISLQQFKNRKTWTVGVSLVMLMAFSLWALFQPVSGWQALLTHSLYLFCLLVFTWRGWRTASTPAQRIALLLVAASLLASRLFLLIPALYQALHIPSAPVISQVFFNSGELLVLLSLLTLWWAYGRQASWQSWLAGTFLTSLFIIPRLLNPAMTGILSIWSTGLSLYLPWPLYALALLLASITVISCLKRAEPAGWAIIFLAAGGYAPQLSYQAFLGLTALWILASSNPQAENVLVGAPSDGSSISSTTVSSSPPSPSTIA